MAKKGKPIYNISVECTRCHGLLFRYAKEGSGHLVKCFESNISDDRTNGSFGCPSCGQSYARSSSMHGRPVRKIIQGKVSVRGHVRN